MNDLKPCPFCGSKPFLNEHGPKVNGHTLWQIGCEEAGCPIDDVWSAGFSRKELAIKAWNTRHEENPRHRVMIVGDDHDRIPLIEAIKQIGFDGIIIEDEKPAEQVEFEIPERCSPKIFRESNADRCGYSTKRK